MGTRSKLVKEIMEEEGAELEEIGAGNARQPVMAGDPARPGGCLGRKRS